MSLQQIRALFEAELSIAYQAMTPSVPVVFDNVQEEPPGTEYVVMSLSYPSFAEPQLCPDESLIEYIRGNIQLACYTPRAQGMRRLEEMATVGMQTLNTIATSPFSLGMNPRMGQLLGPLPVLAGNTPYALVNVSGPFTVRIDSRLPPAGVVNTLHTRSGVVVGEEGDYSFDQLGDVDVSTNPPATDEAMSWDGAKWVPTDTLNGGDF